MHYLQELLHGVGPALGYAAIGLLCLTGVLLSGIGLSGTWLVVLAAALAWPVAGPEFPAAGILVAFVALSGLVELLEMVAGAWGVARRGGSGWAGLAAIAGGLLGLMLGTFIPIPVVGSLVGMMIGSFVLVLLVEHLRLRHAGRAAHIAWGAVLARVFMIAVKLAATLGMSAYLALRLLRSGG